jgi:hypothetical protein
MSERTKYLYTPALVRMVAENAFYAGFNASNALFNCDGFLELRQPEFPKNSSRILSTLRFLLR